MDFEWDDICDEESIDIVIDWIKQHPEFFDDLVEISYELKNSDPKVVALRTDVRKINSKLPSGVYIPFVTGE